MGEYIKLLWICCTTNRINGVWTARPAVVAYIHDPSTSHTGGRSVSRRQIMDFRSVNQRGPCFSYPTEQSHPGSTWFLTPSILVLADRTAATQYDRPLASSYRPSDCDAVHSGPCGTRVGVQG